MYPSSNHNFVYKQWHGALRITAQISKMVGLENILGSLVTPALPTDNTG